MFRKILLFALAISLLNVGGKTVFAGSQNDDPGRLARVKAAVAKRGTGEKARVTIKLHDQKEVKGFVAQAGQDDFVAADGKSARGLGSLHEYQLQITKVE